MPTALLSMPKSDGMKRDTPASMAASMIRGCVSIAYRETRDTMAS